MPNWGRDDAVPDRIRTPARVVMGLALLPLLAASDVMPPSDVHTTNLLEGSPIWLHTVVIMGVIIGIVAIGHYVITPFFRFIADTHLQEIFTASALLIVLAITLLLQLIGLPPALGSFLAVDLPDKIRDIINTARDEFN